MTRKEYSFVGMVIVIVSGLMLFLGKALDYSWYDVEYVGTADEKVVTEGGIIDGELSSLLILGVYLLVSRVHLFLYFKRILNADGRNCYWALPTFDIRKCRVLAAVLSIAFVSLFLSWTHVSFFSQKWILIYPSL